MSPPEPNLRPPRFRRRWLEILLPKGVVGEVILGDLDEEFAERASVSTAEQVNAGLAASLLPARRASKVDPSTVLNAD